jgi:malate synthase
VGAEIYGAGRFKEAREVFEQVALDKDLIVFLTLPAYRPLD